MNWESVVRVLGFGCIVAGVARMGMTPASLIWGVDSTGELSFAITACVLMAVCSLAFYLVQSKETGVLGFITVLAIMIGNMLTLCILWGYAQFGSYGDEQSTLKMSTDILSSVGVLGGAVMLPILTWRAKVFPRWVVALMLLMIGSFALPWFEWFAFFWGLPYVGMGYCIWTGKLNNRQASPNSATSEAAVTS